MAAAHAQHVVAAAVRTSAPATPCTRRLATLHAPCSHALPCSFATVADGEAVRAARAQNRRPPRQAYAEGSGGHPDERTGLQGSCQSQIHRSVLRWHARLGRWQRRRLHGDACVFPHLYPTLTCSLHAAPPPTVERSLLYAFRNRNDFAVFVCGGCKKPLPLPAPSQRRLLPPRGIRGTDRKRWRWRRTPTHRPTLQDRSIRMKTSPKITPSARTHGLSSRLVFSWHGPKQQLAWSRFTPKALLPPLLVRSVVVRASIEYKCQSQSEYWKL